MVGYERKILSDAATKVCGMTKISGIEGEKESLQVFERWKKRLSRV